MWKTTWATAAVLLLALGCGSANQPSGGTTSTTTVGGGGAGSTSSSTSSSGTTTHVGGFGGTGGTGTGGTGTGGNGNGGTGTGGTATGGAAAGGSGGTGTTTTTTTTSGGGGGGAPLSCASICHGDPANVEPIAPPRDLGGNYDTSFPGVGAHQSHLGPSSWHATVLCTECHRVPATPIDPAVPTHLNGARDLIWGPIAQQGTFDSTSLTCTGTYCHGGMSKLPDAAGSTAIRTPQWTLADGTQDVCGKACHTNPPGGSHPPSTNCATCHAQVVSAFDPATNATTWANAALHIDGVVEVSKYHDLGGWKSPQGTGEHHGSAYFLGNGQRDEHNLPCTQCHGANLDGGTSGVACNSCHTDWKSCTFCHGTAPSQPNPPLAVLGFTSPATLGVGDHVAHVATQGFGCPTCHVVPPAGDITHAAQYVPSSTLDTTGHHGDVSFAGAGGAAKASVWNVNATQGTPVTARGTCTQGCHSNGKGGPPIVTPYWAGGAWTPGCGNCHGVAGDTSGRPNTGEHRNGSNKHGNLPCSACHPAAPGASHLDGSVALNATLKYGSNTMSWSKNDPQCSGGRVTCWGTCHGKKCW